MRAASIAVFLFFFSLALLINTAGTALSTSDDPYYHLRHAISYRDGSVMQIPVFSTLRGPQDDLYVWYHRALAPFTRVFGDDVPAAIMGSKVFHALGAALFFLIFFLVLARYLVESRSPGARRARIFLALLGCVTLFAFSPIFFFRMLLLRPHVFAASVVFLSFVALERRRVWLLFFLAVLLPLFYGASFLLFLPLGLYLASWTLYRGSFRLNSTLYAPFLAVLSGLTLGTALHSDPLRYLFNGMVVHLMAIVNRFRAVVPEGGELYELSLIPAEIMWFVPFIASIFFFIRTDRTSPLSWRDRMTFREFYFLTSSLVLMTLTMFVQRAAEYAIPVAFLALFLISAERLPRAVREIRTRMRRIDPARHLDANVKELIESVVARRSFLLRFGGATLAVFMVTTALTAYFTVSNRSGDELRYRGAALAMAADSAPGSLVFNLSFGLYPRLVFWNTHNTYATGMDPTFTYFFDPALYWLLYHTGSGALVCPRSHCSEGDADVSDPYDVLAHDIGAEFAFVDSAVPSLDDRYLEMLTHDPRFELFYEDPEFSEVKVFRILRDF
ncbi:MAG: hypothetical protein Q8R39_02920 [bacterium]|nr:hypothetical protein [bacterium]MDZ4284832.1 hypothetical protein [Patescibacteria group bacterium]